MKEAQFTVEFTSHVLANSVDVTGTKDRFQRDSSGCLIFQQSWWYSAFTKAIEFSRIRGIKPSDISMDLCVKTETKLYDRKYSDDGHREHEAIMPGTPVTFNAIVADHVTESALKSILDKMGTYVGLSPYGHKLGYGKFKVQEIKISPSDAAE